MPRATLAKKPSDVASMFDAVAERYDITNHLTSLWQDSIWRAAVTSALDPGPGMKILDVAAGTGASAVPLAQQGAEVTCCDFSAGMIAEGKRRHPELTFTQGDATDLPFADNSFDAVTISLGLRNVVDYRAALSEMLRVTRPGGKLVICEFSHPVNPAFRSLYFWYLNTVLTRIAKVSAGISDAYEYLRESILDWPNQHELAQAVSQVGWHKVGYRNLSGGIVALHRGFKGFPSPSGAGETNNSSKE